MTDREITEMTETLKVKRKRKPKEKHTGLIDSLEVVMFPHQESEFEAESFTDVGRARVDDWLDSLIRGVSREAARSALAGIACPPLDVELKQRAKRDSIPRHTIEQQSGTIYFRLVEDPQGAWVTFANHNAIVTKLEQRIEAAAGIVPPSEQEYRLKPEDCSHNRLYGPESRGVDGRCQNCGVLLVPPSEQGEAT